MSKFIKIRNEYINIEKIVYVQYSGPCPNYEFKFHMEDGIIALSTIRVNDRDTVDRFREFIEKHLRVEHEFV